MSNVMEVLTALGISASLSGAEPTTEIEYLERVTALGDAELPAWVDIQPELFAAHQVSAIARVDAAIDAAVMEVSGHPSPREVASWPGKLEAAHKVIEGALETARSLVPVMIKSQITPAQAAGAVLLNARIYELANTAAETMRENAVIAIQAATSGDEVAVVEAAFHASKAERMVQLAAITAAAKVGDFAPLEAAEAEIANAVDA